MQSAKAEKGLTMHRIINLLGLHTQSRNTSDSVEFRATFEILSITREKAEHLGLG